MLRVVWGLAFGLFFLLPYAQVAWWSFPLSTMVLVGLLVARFHGSARRRAGLAIPTRAVLPVIAVGIACWSSSWIVVVPWMADLRGIVRDPLPLDQVAVFAFQALNEEVVLGALLLFPLARRTRRPALVALGVALMFAVLHYGLYRYGSLQTGIAATTVATLVGVGIMRNALILLVGHIGYAWALHAAWNLVMFSGHWHTAASGERLSEPRVFDAFFGTTVSMVVSLGLGALLLFCLTRKVVPTRPGAPTAPSHPARSEQGTRR